jgi:3-deoxy-D-arabino-heptulosonate 7-phosphate (DAHP) synthase
MSDGEQSLVPDNFEAMVRDVARVAKAVDREI